MRDPDRQTRLLATLERLLEIPSTDLSTALTFACNAVAEATRADKVDAFLLDPAKNTLVAIGASTQPLSALQRKSGLDILPVANGGRVVHVFQTRSTFRTGNLRADLEELKGIREILEVESTLGVPIDVAGECRGVLMLASQKRDHFNEEDERFVESVSRWVGSIAHRAELVQEIAKNAVEQGRRAVAEELITVLAHDLRNFVAPIAGRVTIIRRRAQQDNRDADVRDSDATLKAVDRLGRLISDLLDVARLDQGVFRLDPRPMDLSATALDVAKTLSSPNHEVRAAAMEEVVVQADPSRVSQCLENLVTNAIRHGAKGAPVTVIVGKVPVEEGELATVDVVDEGPGVPPELLPRIFDRFAAGERSQGLGLGLYLARRIALAHGGDLSVESTPGTRTRFRLQLPIVQEE